MLEPLRAKSGSIGVWKGPDDTNAFEGIYGTLRACTVFLIDIMIGLRSQPPHPLAEISSLSYRLYREKVMQKATESYEISSILLICLTSNPLDNNLRFS